jgi:high-affinity iron transporter
MSEQRRRRDRDAAAPAGAKKPAVAVGAGLAAAVALAGAVAVIAVLAVTAVATPAVAAAAPPPGFKLGGDVAKGRQVYAMSCATCHGDAGDGRGEAAGVLNPRPSDLTDAARMAKLSDWDLYRVIRDGGPAVGLSEAMQAFKPLLPDSDLRNVAAFVRLLAKPKRPVRR